ncbi:hypothetical protein SDRG_12694 [Saprolegnia diclina VS20]|uniref:Ankyrin repeat domain containing protein n=1 Tax=Saprolegnia diclina (strain VS20) TaxID=1156394 RepID=T0PW02_SAPDV|nr:hypothetical protein SDRG_12694 [Saprolegnia diclina VS20]EQC29694.1 hypothetical protein SDRG_12694 [Saprolegnia diclina VS20]|eukprot:XP_008616998.1 hypothetical protein SDRG_12694 [Saprolegnia diclina VS20]
MWATIADVQPLVLAFAGPLTEYLNGVLDEELKYNARNREEVTLRIWTDAFRMDWSGPLERLPCSPCLRDVDFACIRTKTMYNTVMAYFGKCWRSVQRSDYCNATFALANSGNWTKDLSLCDTDAAALRNLWLEDLAPFLEYPIALAYAAVFGGHYELLRYLVREKGVVVADFGYLHRLGRGGFAMDVAAKYGHLAVLQLLHDGGASSCTTAAMDDAAMNGHLDVVQWLQQHRTEGCSPNVLDWVVMNGDTAIVRFLQVKYNVAFSPEALQHAASRPDLDIVKQLHYVWHAPCTTATMDEAALAGNLAIVEFLHRHRTEGCTARAMDNAAFDGSVDVVRFLHEHRSEGCTTLAIDAAARRGHLSVVEFLTNHRSEGCTVHAMDRAAHRGRENVVRYLHEHRTEGCTTRAIDWAASAGHLSIVRFLLTHRSEGFTFRGIYWAAEYDHRDYPAILALLLSHDTTKVHTAAAVARALRLGDRKTFDALAAAGCISDDVDVDAIDWRLPRRGDAIQDDPATGGYSCADADEDEEYFRFPRFFDKFLTKGM